MNPDKFKYAHTVSEQEFNKIYPNEVHAFVLRDNFEYPIRQYNFGKAEKPKLSEMLERYIYLHNHALLCNKAYLAIGFCNAILSREGNFTNGQPLYPEIDRNINCNWAFEDIINHVQSKII
jgi:hypothetical protein